MLPYQLVPFVEADSCRAADANDVAPSAHLECVEIERLVPSALGYVDRPPRDPVAFCAAGPVARMPVLAAFAELAQQGLPGRLHEALIRSPQVPQFAPTISR